MYFCAGHYRQPVDFDDERLTQASVNVRKVRETARRLAPGDSPPWSAPLREEFFAALADDFNTPRALAALFRWLNEANRAGSGVGDADLREMLSVLALDNLLERDVVEAPAEVRELASARERARRARDWAVADALRDQIAQLGWQVRDGPDGPELMAAG
jgi:cysteinyl-tRNA synthetase